MHESKILAGVALESAARLDQLEAVRASVKDDTAVAGGDGRALLVELDLTNMAQADNAVLSERFELGQLLAVQSEDAGRQNVPELGQALEVIGQDVPEALQIQIDVERGQTDLGHHDVDGEGIARSWAVG